jgi:hypothetical protein
MKNISIAILLGALAAAPSFADSVFQFNLVPSGGSVTGAAGNSIGWGYTVTNNSRDEWLYLNAASSTIAFQGGTLKPVFDFPVIPPNTTVTVPWSAGSSGIFEFAIDSGASAGSQTGLFTVSAEWFIENPANADCKFDDTAKVELLRRFPGSESRNRLVFRDRYPAAAFDHLRNRRIRLRGVSGGGPGRLD